jgi:asparagine synthetase B (glutamine-hydrolysing)
VRSAPEEVAESLTLLEVAAGLPLEPYGVRGQRPSRPVRSARAVLERLAADALRTGPTWVSFSGGRDSSLVLAVATHVARKEGLPLPIPVTMCHDSPESQEADWQHRVLEHLAVEDWVRVAVGERMDVLGDEATRLLAADGLQCPPNAYLHLPVVAAAGGGTLLTGVGGDEVLGAPARRLALVLSGAAHPRPRDLASLALAASPTGVRRAWAAGRTDHPYAPWLTPRARAEVVRRLAASRAATRVRWDVDALRFARSRSATMGAAALSRVGDHYGVRVRNPLLDEGFVNALAAELGPVGPRNRSGAMRHLAADLLPEVVLGRDTKAVFASLVWGPRFRQFVADWSPAELDPALRRMVDPEVVRQAWSQERPVFSSMMLVQHAWLRARSARRQLDEVQDGVQRVP